MIQKTKSQKLPAEMRVIFIYVSNSSTLFIDLSESQQSLTDCEEKNYVK